MPAALLRSTQPTRFETNRWLFACQSGTTGVVVPHDADVELAERAIAFGGGQTARRDPVIGSCSAS